MGVAENRATLVGGPFEGASILLGGATFLGNPHIYVYIYICRVLGWHEGGEAEGAVRVHFLVQLRPDP